MKKIIFSLLLLRVSLPGFSTTWTINNSGTSFTPNSITITAGDSVNFDIASIHDVLEVSQSTYDANGTTALGGGFSTPPGGGIVLPAKLTIGTHYYVCTPHASLGMKGIIVVEACIAPDTPGSISGNSTACSGSSTTYSIASVSRATSYTWMLPGGWTGSSTTNTINTTAGSSGGTFSVTANNDCGISAAQTLAVTTISSVPASPGSISGNTGICESGANTYSVSAVNGATSYTWTLPGGWSGSSTTYTINTTAGAASGNVAVTANNVCGSSAQQTLTITVNAVPETPGTISENTNVCAGSSNTYSVTAVNGATSYTWTLPGGWSGASTTNSIATTASGTSGNISVSADNNCGSSSAQTLSVTVNSSAPAMPSSIQGNTTVCDSSLNTYSVPAVNEASFYTWTFPSGWNGTSSTNAVSVLAATTSGNISITASNACGSSSAQALTVTIGGGTALPKPGPIIGNLTICAGELITYSVSAVIGATSYSWTLPGGWSGTSITNTISLTSGSTGGNISVSGINNCGLSAAQTADISVSSLPSAPDSIYGIKTICPSTSNTYSVSPANDATSYSWTLPGGWSGTSVTNSITAAVGTTSGTITVTANNACGTSAIRTLPISVTQIDTSLVLSGGTLTANEASAGYQWINCSGNSMILGETNGYFMAMENGSYAVAITKNGCSDTSGCYSITTAGMAGMHHSAKTSVYPNPSEGTIVIRTKNEISGLPFSITDSLGREAIAGRLNNDHTIIDISRFATGIYYLQIDRERHKLIKK